MDFPLARRGFAMSRLRLLAPLVLLTGLLLAGPARCADESRYSDGKCGAGELRHVNGIPVLIVEGTPEEIGRQTAVLTAKPAQRLLNFPREVLKREGAEAAWPLLLALAKSMEPQFRPAYLKELDAGAKEAKLDRDLLL